MTNETASLTADRILFTDEELDWKSAVRLCAKPLLADGSITADYVDAVIETAEKMGPYFDLGSGVAMPHARPERGAKRKALSFLRTRKPVLLLDQEDHPIEIFIMLSATDAHSHIDVMRMLATVLVDEKNLAALKDATTPEEILAVFTA